MLLITASRRCTDSSTRIKKRKGNAGRTKLAVTLTWGKLCTTEIVNMYVMPECGCLHLIAQPIVRIIKLIDIVELDDYSTACMVFQDFSVEIKIQNKRALNPSHIHSIDIESFSAAG